MASDPPARSTSTHYSYAHYADARTADRFEQSRFGGPIGRLLLETQEQIVTDFVGEIRDRTILDVGTGTGRAALALARRGARVTGVDASAEMLHVASRRAAAERLSVEFAEADAHALPYPDGSFDVAVSLRVLMHTPDWRRMIGELCRVARDRVVVDYPAALSAAAAHAAARRLRSALQRDVEAYRVFRHGVLVREFSDHAFRVVRVHQQFVLPIALHKLLGSRRFTEISERLLASFGLLRLLGSPVTILAVRCTS
jgi:ubiquinone/menaquinone biosynthesis C-methylase UbiE